MKNRYLSISLFIFLFQGIISYGQNSALSIKSNKCLAFNGKTSEVTFKNNDMNLSAGTTMTVTAWIKWTSLTNANPWANMVTLTNSTGPGDVGQFWFQHNQTNTKFEFAVQTVNTRNIIQSTTAPVVGAWYHIAGVYDGSYITLYVNGVMEGKNPLTGNINPFQSTFKLSIGKWANSEDSCRRFNGNIDEISIWKTALTQTDIRNMMCHNLRGNETGLIGYWAMNESSGTTLYDFTSNARNGINLSAVITESGAPVGTASTYIYGGSRVSLKHPVNGDSLVIDNFSTALPGIHVYRIDSILNVTTPPGGFKRIIPYYYGVFAVNSSGQTYQLTYYYSGHPDITAATMLGIARRATDSEASWKDLQALQNFSNATVVKTGQTNRNLYILSEPGDPLFVSLVNFTAHLQDGNVEIEWTTASEKNNAFFVLEKSKDGIGFDSIAIRKGAGNSSVPVQYKITDYDPTTGLSYYRLRQVGLDGSISHSATVCLTYNTEGIKICSNPVTAGDVLYISLPSEKNNPEILVVLRDMQGQEYYSKMILNVEGHQLIAVNPDPALAPGIYIVIASSDHSFYSQKVIVK